MTTEQPATATSDEPPAGAPTGTRRLGRPADLQRGREPPRRSPRRSSRPCRARRCSSSTTARPTAPADSPTSSRPPTRGSGSATGPPSRASAGPTSTASASRSPAAPTTVVQMDADWSPRPGRRCPALDRADRGGRRRPRHRLALHAGRRRRRLGARPAAHLARRQRLRPDRPRPRPERPDRRLQGLAGGDPRGDPVRRRPRRRLRLPDRDDVPGRRGRGPRSARCRSRSATAGSASRR